MAKQQEFKSAAIDAAHKAGRILMRRFREFDRGSIKMKSHHEILTEADLAAERAILGILRSRFPGHRILSEEAGDSGVSSDYLWVVDPLDGTTNFSMHNPLFSVSIGLFHKEENVLGLVYAPFLDEHYVAEKDKGAWIYSGAKPKNRKQMKVSGIGTEKAINTFCHGSQKRDIAKAASYMRKQKLKHLDCRQLGSAAIELAYVASGRTESIAIPGAHAWDVAAGVLLVREAGGRVTDFQGNPWTLKSNDILASNSKVHKDLLSILG